MKEKKKKKVLCLYFNNTSLYFLTFIEVKYIYLMKYTSEFENSFWILEIYFKYTSELERKNKF